VLVDTSGSTVILTGPRGRTPRNGAATTAAFHRRDGCRRTGFVRDQRAAPAQPRA